MKMLHAFLDVIINSLSFSLLKCNGSLYQTGWAISYGLYCQFENVWALDTLNFKVISELAILSALFLLPNISNSSVQSLEILFIFSSMLLILHHSLKIMINSSMQSC